MNTNFSADKSPILRNLSGVRILITRPEHQAEKLKYLLEQHGATVLLQPAIQILPPETWEQADNAIANLDSYNYIVFSSVNGVEMYLRRLNEINGSCKMPSNIFVAAVGDSTAQALNEAGIHVDIIPDNFRAENLAERLLENIAEQFGENCGEVKVLLLRASRGRDVLAPSLGKCGIITEQIPIYRSVDVTQPRAEIVKALQNNQIDWVALTSSAIAQSTINMLGEFLGNAKIACISPITESTVIKNGFHAAAVAKEYTLEGLVRAVAEATCPAPYK